MSKKHKAGEGVTLPWQGPAGRTGTGPRGPRLLPVWGRGARELSRSPIPGESPSWPSYRVLCAPETVPCAPRAAGGAKSAVSSGHDSSPARSGPHSTTSTNVSSHVILQKTELEGQTGQGFDDECHH